MATSIEIGRNDLCLCGSGRKYKKCCLAKAPQRKASRDVDQLYIGAVRLYNQGQVREAETLCRRILSADRDNADALELLGIIVTQQGENGQAVDLFRRAIAVNPAVASYHSNLGAALQKLQLKEEAADEYRAALKLEPNHANALCNLGGLLRDLDHAEEALPLLERARELDPNLAMTHVNLGLVLWDLGRQGEGVHHIQRAAELGSNSLDLVVRCAKTLLIWERWAQAVPHLRRWLELDPGNADALSALGNCYGMQDLRGEAAECYAKVLQIRPDDALAANNLGSCFCSEGHLADAVAFYRKALDLKPDFVDAWTNLGKVLRELGQSATALCCYQMALVLKPGHVTALWGSSFCDLSMGNLTEGWALYEWGWEAGARKPKRPFEHPRWNGENPAGKTILVWMEQGIGDHILFASMIPDLINAGAHCLIECEWRLTSLFRRSFPEAEVFTAKEPRDPRTQAEDIDFQVPIASLAQWLRPTIESFPQRQKYLVPDPSRVAYWGDCVRSLGDGLKIGICWRSMLNKGPRAMHYPDLAKWGPILTTPGIKFVNLQYDQCEQELVEAEAAFNTTIHRWENLDLKNDIEGVAALVSTLDLVISADSTPAPIAGALGVPVWVIAREAGAWSLLGQNYFPWQPSCRYSFSRTTDPWEPNIDSIAKDLRQLVEVHQQTAGMESEITAPVAISG
jgi:tetratricopeptide (TPR) repeat protein